MPMNRFDRQRGDIAGELDERIENVVRTIATSPIVFERPPHGEDTVRRLQIHIDV